MTNWLNPTLKWGGIVVAVAFAIALFLAGQFDTAAEGAAEAASTAPIVLYWVLFAVGVVAAVIGFVLASRQKT